MKKLSVVVTTYNRPILLKETIQSILNQTFNDFELIIVDNLSNYNFFELLNSYNDPRIKGFQNENNGIIATNRNFGINKASGEFVAFCDDDDLWVENKLELQMKVILSNDCDFISSNMFLFKSSKENVIGKTKNRLVSSFNDFLKCNQINTSSVIAKKSSILEFNETIELVSIEDFDLWLKLYKKNYKFFFIKLPLVYYRISDQNTSAKNYANKHLRIIYLMINILLSESNNKNYLTINKIIISNYFKFILKKIMRILKK